MNPVKLFTNSMLAPVAIALKNSSCSKRSQKNSKFPLWLAGFIDAEGSFVIRISKNKKVKSGWSVRLVFFITLHAKDLAILEIIKKELQIGRITLSNIAPSVVFQVNSIKEIKIIIKLLDKNNLITQKQADFLLFKQVFELMLNKEHLTEEGILKIVALKAANNNGLSDLLKEEFSNILPAPRPKVENQIVHAAEWVAGFTSGEGCFFISISSQSYVIMAFQLTQNVRDENLVKTFIKFFNCGNIYFDKTNLTFDYRVTKLSDLLNKIIPFFKEFPILGVKAKDFEDWCLVAEMVKQKQHLNPEGLEKIRKIKRGMNKNRISDDNEKKTLLDSNPSTRRPSIKSKGSINKRHYSSTAMISKEQQSDQIQFFEWMAGLIDGDGQFQTTKKGFSSLKIIMGINDKYPLYEIKHKYGGSIKPISGSNALKYKLHNLKGLINLIKDVNGLIRNPARMLQLNRICEKYNINLLEPKPLTRNNGWFSGFIDSDGSIHIDEKSGQLIISVTQKNKYLLNPLQILYGGRIQILRSKDAFIYSIYRKQEILKLVDGYFKNFPLKSSKTSKIKMIKEFYLLSEYRDLNINYINEFNQWVTFKDKWDKI